MRDGNRRYKVLLAFSANLNNIQCNLLTPDHFIKYRSHKLALGVSLKTLNNHLGYFKAVFNELISTNSISIVNPFLNIKPFKIQERELSFLTSDQIEHLLSTIRTDTQNPHVELITLICLSTGCRWSEAEGLKMSSLNNSTITFTRTKSGKNRTVPIPDTLLLNIREHLTKHNSMTSSLGAFRRALQRSGIQLPVGQSSHVLRHTFASHFVSSGGSILVLQKILGHSTINMTMRYAHLAPDHLREAITYSPIRHFFDTKEKAQATEL